MTEQTQMTSAAVKSLDFLAPTWQSLLKEEFSSSYINNLRQFLKKEQSSNHPFFPAKENIFRALKLVDYNDVRVVILGQDPYHGPGQANGLAFAVQKDVPMPPSLKNIFKEVRNDLGLSEESCLDRTLEGWAQQGVLLLNSVLTVRAHTALSHREKGWETLTAKVLEHLNERSDPVVFLLWGSSAQNVGRAITKSHHKIFQAPHPSPLSAHRGFLGCRHFSQTNAFLKSLNQEPILWSAK